MVESVKNNLLEKEIDPQDAEFLRKIILKLYNNRKKLDASQRLTAVNLVLKLAITRDAAQLVIPPMDNLE